MLKRLELVGFKSFADKTQFDFTSGLTAVVGPNGSGKSNIVDAVRWILGEQSAKSLRGGEMADVIFNGSTSRRALGMAEVTLTFETDNLHRSLALPARDHEEVQITRRVYREGVGEYLINQQPCRLKDIKDLFLGTGAGSDAYCIIEQGRVEVLLQSSTRERRTVFEEAAGISRFKARKLETARKLERVDQNLQRVRDIIEEVEKQLRAVKLQASKAQRWQEYSARLRSLRVALGLQEYHELSGRLADETVVLEKLRALQAAQLVQSEEWDADMRRLEEALGRLDAAASVEETRLGDARQRIAVEEATLQHDGAQERQLDADVAAAWTNLLTLRRRVDALADTAARSAQDLGEVERFVEDRRGDVAGLEEADQSAAGALAELQQRLQADKADHMEQMRLAARLQNEAVAARAHHDTLLRERQRLLTRTEHAAENLVSISETLRDLEASALELETRLGQCRSAYAQRQAERDQGRERLAELDQELADLRGKQSGVTSRIEVLEKFEQGREGLDSGARELFAWLESGASATDGGFPCWTRDWIPGMVADVLSVQPGFAPLIDLALESRSRHFLVRDAAALLSALAGLENPFSGRVGFYVAPPTPPHWTTLAACVADLDLGADDLVAAEDLVECDDPEWHFLPRFLLGGTYIVRDLALARTLAERLWSSGQGNGSSAFRFVTRAGEVLDADGGLTVGLHRPETGILSRKAELRELREELAELIRDVADREDRRASERERLADMERELQTLHEQATVLSEQAADLRSHVQQHRLKQEGLHQEVELSRREISNVESEAQAAEAAWHEAERAAAAADQRAQELQGRLDESDRAIRLLEQQWRERQQEIGRARAALAAAEEKLASIRGEHARLDAELAERRQEKDREEVRFASAVRRRYECKQALLQAHATLAALFVEKESAEAAAADLARQREALRQERYAQAQRTQAARGEWRARQEEVHAHELHANDLRNRRAALTDRLREDYQIELEEIYQSWRGDGPAVADFSVNVDGAAAEEEIGELRRKLSRLGSVNLDSLQDLEELEARAADLRAQFDDLSSAKQALEAIIAEINDNSRRLFLETFEMIRGHFQELFRKLFGGGMADIVLEDAADVLESGIEIVARPPGKELRSISLMSGGEKTLTVVALLLAIFRSKPSPFCILDEVDAALDEANIERFTAVLREFLDQSQFILITHSKKTMAAADVLYGVTMQESGVSKRVAVRFEDWVEEPVA